MKTQVSQLLLTGLLMLSMSLTLVGQQTQAEKDGIPPLDELLGRQDTYRHFFGATTPDSVPFNQGNIYDPFQLIQGRLAGVSITRPGGDPNREFQMRIRGVNTLTSNWRPLIVIDGVAGMSLDNLDPNDIGNIQVLKTAAASAMYGMRGANGVVLITTKRTTSSEPKVTAHASVAVDRVGKLHQTLSADEFRARGGRDYGSSSNMIDELIQTGLTENLGFSIRQSVNGFSYSASVNYRDLEGLVQPSNRQRLNSNIIVTQKAINDRLRVSLRVNNVNESRGDVADDLFRHMTLNNPTAPVFDDVDTELDGGYFSQGVFGFTNAVALHDETILQQERKQLAVGVQLAFDITSFLTISGQYTQDRSNVLSGEYRSRFSPIIGRSSQGYAERNSDDRFTELADIGLHVNKAVNDDLTISGSLSMGFVKNTFEGFTAGSARFLFDAQTYNNLGAGANLDFLDNIDSYRTEDRLNSMYGSVEVNYKESLQAFFNWRSDTYSGFIEDKTGLFYGGGVRYDLTEVMDAGNSTKIYLRGGYGITGNLPIRPYLGEARFEEGLISDLDDDPLTTDDRFRNISQIWNFNPTLTWEKVKELNLGLDFSIGDFGLSGSVDYFSRNSEDLIFREFVPIGSPNVFAPGEFFTSFQVNTNFIDMSSSGVELSLNYERGTKEGILWQSQLNTTFYQQPVIDRMGSAINRSIESLSGFGFLSVTNGTNFVSRQILGEEIGGLYTPQYLGRQEDGTPLIEGSTSDVNLERAGNSLPTSDIGVYNRLVKGKWELNFLLRGSTGHSLLNVTRMIHENSPVFPSFENIVTSGSDPGLNQTVVSDLYVEDASFLRLNHLTISRDFSISTKSTLNVSLTGQNLFTLTGYEGIDPEVRYLDRNQSFEPYQALASGIATRELYFPSRTYTLQVRISF